MRKVNRKQPGGVVQVGGPSAGLGVGHEDAEKTMGWKETEEVEWTEVR